MQLDECHTAVERAAEAAHERDLPALALAAFGIRDMVRRMTLGVANVVDDLLHGQGFDRFCQAL